MGARPGPEEADALAAVGMATVQQAAVVAVDEAAEALGEAINSAEAAGLLVEVRQEVDFIHAYGDLYPRRHTVGIKVQVMKRLR